MNAAPLPPEVVTRSANSRTGFLVLHALRLKGLAGVDALATATGLGADQVAGLAADLGAQGLALERAGRMPGWSLTPAGRDTHARALAEELDASGRRAAVQKGYEGILRSNEPFKALCTAWQLRSLEPPVANDHADPAYDAAVVERLVDMHHEAMPMVEALGDALARFRPYRGRFEVALGRIRAGDTDWFTKPLIGSYHDVWMELHEDLLLTLGIARREGST